MHIIDIMFSLGTLHLNCVRARASSFDCLYKYDASVSLAAGQIACQLK